MDEWDKVGARGPPGALLRCPCAALLLTDRHTTLGLAGCATCTGGAGCLEWRTGRLGMQGKQ